MIYRLLSEVRYRARAILQRSQLDAEMDEELMFHLERATEKYIAMGLPEKEAVRMARIEFGGLEQIKSDTKQARGLTMLEHFLQDMRYALRGLRSQRTFTAGVVITIALGIGANATMFGIVDRVLFRAPPTMTDAHRVHRVYRHNMGDQGERIDRNLAFATYRDIATLTSSFDVVAAFQTRNLAVGDGDAAREVRVTVASADFFDLFSARPALGRFFGDADDAMPEGAPVVVLGYAYWQSEFGGRDVLGEQLRVNRTLCTIIGVAPPGFVGMSDQGVPAAYIPITTYAFSLRAARYTNIYTWSWAELVVRRKADVSVAAATTDLSAALVQSWRHAFEASPGWGTPEDQQVRGSLDAVQLERGPNAARESRVAIWTAGVALIVLLITCANVANLLLSRAVSRRREIAMRLALGVSGARLIRQLLTESLLLAALGGALGLAIAQWGAAGIRAWFLPPGVDAGVITDARTLLFAAAATVVAGLLTGIAPAFYALRTNLTDALRGGARESGLQGSRSRAALLVFQTALSVVLLVGAGLFVRSLNHVKSYRLGYDHESVLFASVNTRGLQLEGAQLQSLNQRLVDAASATPGVASVSLAVSVPFWSNEGRGLLVPGVDSVSRLGYFILQAGSADYFRTMGTRIVRGRGFEESDVAGSERVAVVSEGMARVLWPAGDALDKCFRLDDVTAPCIRVVGIAEEARARSIASDREFMYYLPISQYDGDPYPQLFARVTGDPSHHVEVLRQRLQAQLPAPAYINVTELSSLVDPNLRSWKFGATMFAAFGALALILAGVGLYSLIAYDVAQKSQELSIRVALGASVSRVISLVMYRGLTLVVLGVVLGSAAAILAAPSVQDLLFEQNARDPMVLASIALMLVVVGTIATVGPAFRAARVDPMQAMRSD